MPAEVKTCTRGDLYIPMDGPWNSEEDNQAFAKAEELFNDLKNKHDYVALVQSHHEYTHGYWVEIGKRKTEFPDHILRLHDKNNLHEKPNQ